MYYRPRIIPCLTMINKGLVKTTKFKNPRYIGDPINTVKIFNGKGIDELCILDITATIQNKALDFDYLKDIASEAFMPLSYGGGIKTIADIEKLFYIGYEKVIVNTAFITDPLLITEAVKIAGSQSIVISIDVKNELFGKKSCYTNDGTIKAEGDPVTLAKKAESLGAGEILLNSMTCDGMMQGYDIELVKQITSAVSIPVIACGGARDINDLKLVLNDGGAHAAAAGSLFIYYGKQKAVLITAPDESELIKIGVYKN